MAGMGCIPRRVPAPVTTHADVNSALLGIRGAPSFGGQKAASTCVEAAAGRTMPIYFCCWLFVFACVDCSWAALDLSAA